MGEIYDSARLVCVCIGTGTADVDIITGLAPELESCDLDIDAIATYIRAKKTAIAAVEHMPPSPTTSFMQRLDSSGLIFDTRFRQACQRFALRSYWERLWIMQELVLSKDKVMLCGHRVIAWRLALNLLIYNNNLHGPLALLDSKSPLQHLGQILLPNRNADAEKSQFAILCLFKCFDPRDRVYGTLGFVDWTGNGLEVYPDYERTRVELGLLVWEKGLSRKQNPHDLFRMLGIDGKCSEIRELVRQRCKSAADKSNLSNGVGMGRSRADGLKAFDQPRSDKELLVSRLLEDRTQSDTLEGTPRLQASAVKLREYENQLFATLWRDTTQGVEVQQESNVLYDRLIRILNTRHLNQSSDALTRRLCQRPPREVLFRGNVAAVVCYEAAAGDYLVQLHQWQQDSHCLVVRRVSHELEAPEAKEPYVDGKVIIDRGLFTIVGQALLLGHSQLVSLHTIRIKMSSHDWVSPGHSFHRSTSFQFQRL